MVKLFSFHKYVEPVFLCLNTRPFPGHVVTACILVDLFWTVYIGGFRIANALTNDRIYMKTISRIKCVVIQVTVLPPIILPGKLRI